MWDFGDGASSKDKNPTHIYNNCGIYTVSLKSTGKRGKSNLLLKQISVLPKSTIFRINSIKINSFSGTNFGINGILIAEQPFLVSYPHTVFTASAAALSTQFPVQIKTYFSDGDIYTIIQFTPSDYINADPADPYPNIIKLRNESNSSVHYDVELNVTWF